MAITIDLEDLINQAVNTAIQPHLSKLTSLQPSLKVYTTEDVQQMLGVSRRHLQTLRDERRISFIQSGRVILFTADDLLNFFATNKVARREFK